MIKFIKKNIKSIILVIVCITSSILSTVATSYVTSKDVYYDNSDSNLNAGDMQEAIDEVFQHATDYNNMNTRVTALENNFLDKTYPVGSIYISATDSTAEAVATRFGGTWEAYATGRPLIGVGTGTDANSTSQTFNINTTGGEYTHKLTVNEMPSHTHTGTFFPTGSQGAPGNSWYLGGPTSTGWDVQTGSRGGSQSHNNIQPYITVYMWKRTA